MEEGSTKATNAENDQKHYSHNQKQRWKYCSLSLISAKGTGLTQYIEGTQDGAMDP